jgi:ubiquitin-protein ligase E3 C
LFRLAVRPLAAVQISQHPEYLVGILVHLLSISLLPSRLPLDVLSQFVAALPLIRFDILAPHIATIVAETGVDGRINLAATLHVFVSPHYKLLPPVTFQTYLELSVALINSFPHSILDPPSKDRGAKLKSAHYSAFTSVGYDSDDSDVQVVAVTNFQTLPPLPIPKVDDKTLKRLNTIVSPQHLKSITQIAISDRTLFPQLILYLSAIATAWSSSRGHVLDTILASTGGGLVREIYRELVRNSPLGKTESPGVLSDPANSAHFPPLIFLVDLYTQALLTMGDDEFFSTSTSSRRNPFMLDELIAFSKQLLNITFPLYWRDDAVDTIGEAYISKDVRTTWGLLKEKLTRCLLAIHARE